MDSKKTVVFFDLRSPRPYDPTNFTTVAAGVGGTQISVVRIAQSLGSDVEVWVAQRTRTKALVFEGTTYLPSNSERLSQLKPDAVIALRQVNYLPRLRYKYPHARLFAWFHDWFFAPTKIKKIALSPLQLARVAVLAATDTHFIGVSKTHVENWRRYCDCFASSRLTWSTFLVHLS